MNKLLSTVLQAIEDKKAHDVVVLDISGVSSFTDHFVLCTGTSSRQNQAIADAVEEEARKMGVKPAHVEGFAHAEWILIDFIDLVVHIFSPTSRAFYDLERLWQDGKRIDSQDRHLESPQKPRRSAAKASPARNPKKVSGRRSRKTEEKPESTS